MCGRYVLSSQEKIKNKFGININVNYNVSPQSIVLVLDNELVPRFLKWTYTLTWTKKSLNLINARIESLYEKAFFKNSLRCIFIADGYFEWKKEKKFKQPYYHYVKSNLMYFAGIFNQTGCCIVTKKSDSKISHIHHRQPLLLQEKYFKDWISCNYDFKSIYDETLHYHEVSTEVNVPNNNSLKNIVRLI